jgi:membrane protein implicated in regulation of membrane protease activity
VIIVVVSLVREGAHARLIYGALALLIASFGLAAGVWLSWLFLTALAAGGVISGVFKWPESPATSIILINGIMLALLLARPTRRYARRGRPWVLRWFRRRRAA